MYTWRNVTMGIKPLGNLFPSGKLYRCGVTIRYRNYKWIANTTNIHNTSQFRLEETRASPNNPEDIVPPPINKHHHKVKISMDIFLNGIFFLHNKSVEIDFRSVQACNSRAKTEMISGLNQVRNK